MRSSRAQRTLTITARIKPRSKTPGVAVRGRELVIRVESLPIDGRANAEAAALLAELFGVPKTRVELVAGGRSRIKRFSITAPARIPTELRR